MQITQRQKEQVQAEVRRFLLNNRFPGQSIHHRIWVKGIMESNHVLVMENILCRNTNQCSVTRAFRRRSRRALGEALFLRNLLEKRNRK